ncbi:hypothetical protein RHMOL_Rhmol07G0179200 [Rhododendron molle]|uniref:Uncharacterized protein n=1 Tax=Rhododendron molle TaxID=49168 RepID=A0ACC0N3D6_RHOML|nr:hypothetical protein RHMOL_Rhmol07G0179200 [Rhododendron molle]
MERELISSPNLTQVISTHPYILAATIYLLWAERNLRIFQNKRRDLEGVTTVILEAIRAKLSSLSSVKFSVGNRDLCDDWLLDS